jgi:hypothetical protein
MKSMVVVALFALAGCGSPAAVDMLPQQIQEQVRSPENLPDSPATTINAPPAITSCIAPGAYTLQWTTGSQSEDQEWCSTVAFPEPTTIHIDETLPFLGCILHLSSVSSADECVYESDCVPVFGSVNAQWNGEVSFAPRVLFYPRSLNGGTVYEWFRGEIGMSEVVVPGFGGECFATAIIQKEEVM